MHEIAELADDCTVFCNGRSVASYAAGTKTDDEVVELMIGREYGGVFPAASRARAATRGAPRARGARSWAGPTGSTTSRSQLHAGEVVGLGGLDGQGQRELLLALFGVLRGVDRRGAGRRPAGRASPARAPPSAPTSAWR